MVDSVHLWLPNAEKTMSAGASLAETLSRVPVTIFLRGPLGAGKTTFLQGFAQALGITEPLVSPTYALEQRYPLRAFGEFLHIDLYRLSPRDAEKLIAGSEDHRGVRCIEWAERLGEREHDESITVTLEDEEGKEGRSLTVQFGDIALPSRGQIEAWREDVCLPLLIRKHCDAVASAAVRLGEALLKRGQIVRLEALRAAAQTHDLLRFVDFHRGTAHAEHDIHPEHVQRWAALKAQYPDLRHEAAAAQFLTGQGYPELGDIVRVHGLTLADSSRVTIEQKLLYYADKRVKLDDVVSLEERLRDFTERYSRNGRLQESDAWYDEARKTERLLFPEGPPF